MNIILSTDDRFFEIAVPSDSVKNGNTVTLGTADGLAVLNSEGESSSKTWAATAGTLTFSNVSDSDATVTLKGLAFSPSDAFSMTTGTGTFELNGKVVAKALQTGTD